MVSESLRRPTLYAFSYFLQEAQLSPRHPREALYQSKSWPPVVGTMQTDRMSVFHRSGPAAAKLLSPKALRARETASVLLEDERRERNHAKCDKCMP